MSTNEAIDLREVPPHKALMAQQVLAQCFIQNGLLPNAVDLLAAGFDNPQQLVDIGWITKTPGRYSSTYLPGPELQALIEERRAL